MVSAGRTEAEGEGAEVSNDLKKLEQQHRDKTLEIEAVVAQALGIGAAMAKEEAGNLIEGFETSMMNGETPREWQAHEESVAAIAIGKLLLERYEIAEQILDGLDGP